MLGTLRGFDVNKDYGYITADHDQRSVFVHGREFDRAGLSPEPGMRLRFRTGRDNHRRDIAVELRELP